jgi:hypothetical protein
MDSMTAIEFSENLFGIFVTDRIFREDYFLPSLLYIDTSFRERLLPICAAEYAQHVNRPGPFVPRLAVCAVPTCVDFFRSGLAVGDRM